MLVLFFPQIKTNSKQVYIVYRLAALAIFTIFTACHSNPQIKQTALPGDIPIQLTLPAPLPLVPGEGENLHVACESWFNTMLKSRGFNGGIVVAKKGNIVFEAYQGSGRPGGKDTITDSTPFHLASVSKTFTAMAVLKLWQEGKLNIDDEFSKYFPAFNYPGVTIRTLLNHRSGLPNYVHFMEDMGWDKKINITNQDVLDFLIKHKAEMADVGLPNRGFAYCNTNFALLALLIENVSGKKYGDYLKETFFTPFNMTHTFVYDFANDSEKVTMSYDWRGKLIPLNFLDRVYGDKNIYSTPRDLLTWDRVLTSGNLFTKKTLDEAYAPYSNEKPGIKNYGLGWRMNIYPSGKKMIYHNGWWHGNNAAFIRLLQDSATIIVLGNKYDRGIYHARDLANLFGNYFGDISEDESESNKTVVPRVRHRHRSAPRKGASAVKTHSSKRTSTKSTGKNKRKPAVKKRRR